MRWPASEFGGLTKSDQDPPVTEDIDVRALGRALWRAKGWILGLAVGAGAVTFIVLSMLRPLYTSEARILIGGDDSTLTQRALDAQAVQSQVQAITSRDLAVEVIKALDLTNNPAFAEDAGASPVGRLLRGVGLGRGSERSEEDKAANTFAEQLSVFPLAKSSVVAIDYTSGDSGLAAQIANKLADAYIAWQRQAALEQTKDATAWLNAQIEVLRPKVAEAEAAVEQFKASGSSGGEIKLRALEGEAKAERDLLESYLARYRDASAGHDLGAVPTQAAIVSRAHASILPSFPQRGPISLLVALATALLSLAYVLPRALIGSPAVPRQAIPANDPRLRMRNAPAAPPRQPAPPEPAAATASKPAPMAVATMAAEPTIWRPSPADDVERPRGTSTRIFAPTSAQGEVKPQRPSFLPMRRRSDTPQSPATAKPDAMPAASPLPAYASDVSPSEQSAAGLINRLRRSLAGEDAPAAPAAPSQAGWIERRRASKPTSEENRAVQVNTAVIPTPGETMPTLSTNDLRAYLNQRLASRGTEAANDPVGKSDAARPNRDADKARPVLKSLEAVINHILACGKGGAPRALLVVGASPKVDATPEAIFIARALVARREQIVLVDLTRGPAAISGPLGIPRSPGFSDLAAGRAGFENVVRVDAETPLQVIAAGNPKLAASVDENKRFGCVFDALTQAYDCVVLHADREAVRALTPALKFELPLVVAILRAGASADDDKADLADFSALGCPVLVYEQTGRQPRSRLFGRVAAG